MGEMGERLSIWQLRRLWPFLKVLLGLAILIALIRQFAPDLQRPELWDLHPGWLLLSGLLYLAGMSLSALYWRSLLARLGYRLTLRDTSRAYFISQLGKYLPGKALALAMRAGIARGAGVPISLSVLTSVYEVLTTMAAGSLLAALLFLLFGVSSGTDKDYLTTLGEVLQLQVPAEGVLDAPVAVVLCLGLFLVTALPLTPTLFNRLVRRMPGMNPSSNLSTNSEGGSPDSGSPTTPAAMPSLDLQHLLTGIFLTGLVWLFLGAAFFATLQAFRGLGLDVSGSVSFYARLPAGLALANVAGFVIPVPGGLGIREFLLTLYLAPELSGLTAPSQQAGTAVLVVLILRLVWTAAEVILAAILWLVPGSDNSARGRTISGDTA